jgi:hypothetical protein
MDTTTAAARRRRLSGAALRRSVFPLLRWVSQYEQALAHYRAGPLSPSPAALTAQVIRQVRSTDNHTPPN